ncbi:MAG: sugar phosphate isomerase/epimerase [Acidobacteria bacterium]|nr:sugar phosphate isomerase/epimerase [Acidobacteriota bacterium]
METVSRRQLLAGSALGLAGALRADPLGLPIGFQSFSVRELIGKDFAGTLRQMAALGYRSVEMCSPPGYEKSGFGSLIKLKASEVRGIIQAAGLTCESSHYGFRELKESLDDRIAYAKELGLKQMIVSSFGLRPEATLDDWRRAAEDLNNIGEKTRKAGLQAGFHNHNGEFKEIGGVLIYDELLRRFDPKLVKLQFQVAVVSIGFEAATYLNRFPGRFISLHLADWSATEKKSVAVGQGVVDWKKLFAAAKKGGVKNYYVEMNLDLLQTSVPYLRQLKG